MKPQEFLRVVNSKNTNVKVDDLCGRIIRGKFYEDFETLTDDPSRLVVMLTDSEGLQSLIGKSGYQMLLTIGHHPEHILDKLRNGYSYKLVVFPSTSAILGTWENVLKMASEVYPSIAEDCKRHAPTLMAKKFAEIEFAAGYRFMDVDKQDHPQYMNHERYLQSQREAHHLRALLYHVLHLRELYSGDGFTYDENGVKGVREYLMLNKKIKDIPGALVQNLSVAVER